MLAALASASPIPGFSEILLDLPGPIDLRWYSMAYIAGLLIAWWYVLKLRADVKFWTPRGVTAPAGAGAPFNRDDVDELLFLSTIGVIVGGRLGYVLFYMHQTHPGWWSDNPLQALQVWQGGMSFHGGLIGVGLAMAWLAYSRKLPVLRIADAAATITPVGLGLGRLANFINGELYGRIVFRERTYTEDGAAYLPGGDVVPVKAGETVLTAATAANKPWWAVHFPRDAEATRVFRETADFSGEGLRFVFYRHPSQLYEAVLEGLVLFLVLFVLTRYYRILARPGLATGVFLAGYGVFRTLVETVRQPDFRPDGSYIELPFGLTMGMVLSLPMVALGAALIVYALRNAAVVPTAPTQPAKKAAAVETA